MKRPTVDEKSLAGAARRIDRSVGDRDADKVNKRQRQADGNGRKSLGRPLVRRSHDHHQEYKSQNQLADESGSQRIPAGRVVPVPIGGESA